MATGNGTEESVRADQLPRVQYKVTKLEPNETMAERRAAERLAVDCTDIEAEISKNPGHPGKWTVAEALDLGVARVSHCIRWLNHPDSPFQPVEYGTSRAKTGKWASNDPVRGWFPMKRAVHQKVLGQMDDHKARIEDSIRESRLRMIAKAEGLNTKTANAVIEAAKDRIRGQEDARDDAEFDWEELERRVGEEAAKARERGF